MTETTPTLYEWAGGLEAIGHMIDAFALLNSVPDADVVDHAPVPRWGWGVAPPWQPN